MSITLFSLRSFEHYRKCFDFVEFFVLFSSRGHYFISVRLLLSFVLSILIFVGHYWNWWRKVGRLKFTSLSKCIYHLFVVFFRSLFNYKYVLCCWLTGLLALLASLSQWQLNYCFDSHSFSFRSGANRSTTLLIVRYEMQKPVPHFDTEMWLCCSNQLVRH